MVTHWGIALGYIRKHPWQYIVLCVLTLLLLVSVFGTVFTQTVSIVEKMQNINDLSVAVTPQIGGNLQDPSSMVPLLKQQKAILEDFKDVRNSWLLLLIGVFGLWILFAGIFWFIIEKKKIHPYLLQFIGLSAGWYAAFLLVGYIVFSILSSGIQGIGTAAIGPVFTSFFVLVFVFGYFASISFALLGRVPFRSIVKKTFLLTYNRGLYVFETFAHVIIGFVFVVLLMIGLGSLLSVLSLIGMLAMILYIPIAVLFIRSRIQSIVSDQPTGKKSPKRSARRPKASA